jgi:hypothetical protein
MPEFKWLNWVNSEQYEPTISNLGSTVLSVMKRIGIERADYIDETWVRAYSSAFPNLAECRGAIQFPRNISERTAFEFLQELYENYSIEKLQAIPAMCVVGDEDSTTPADIRVAYPASALVSQFIQINNPPGAVFNEPSRAWNESSKWALAPGK